MIKYRHTVYVTYYSKRVPDGCLLVCPFIFRWLTDPLHIDSQSDLLLYFVYQTLPSSLKYSKPLQVSSLYLAKVHTTDRVQYDTVMEKLNIFLQH